MLSSLGRAVLLPLKLLFSFDVLISYSRRDGTGYAEALERELGRSIAPRMDIQESKPDPSIPLSLHITIALSKVLVVLSTPEASESIPVRLEIQTLIKRSRGPRPHTMAGGHNEDVEAVAFAPDGSHLASGCGDNTIRIWSLRESGAPPQVLSGHKGTVRSVAFSPDGKNLASYS